MVAPKCLYQKYIYVPLFLPPSPIIMEGLHFKICQNFVATKFFLSLLWGINLYGGGGSPNYMGKVIFITTLSVSLMNFFRKCKCIKSCYLPISLNLPKKSFFVLIKTAAMEKCSVSCIIVITVVIKILEKNLLKSCFRNKFLGTFCRYINPEFKPQILEHLFWRTVPLAVSGFSYILVDIGCTVFK